MHSARKMGDTIRQLVERLKQEAAAQKKKAAALGGLFLVLLIAVGRLVFSGGDTPQAAVAAPTPVVVASGPEVIAPLPAAPPVRPTKTPQGNSRGDATGFANSGAREPRNINMSELPRTLARDPFRSPSWFRKIAQTETATDVSQTSLFDRLTSRWSEYQSRAQARERMVDEKLAEFELQSTLIGPVNSAYISGRLVHEGDEIEGFSVVQIETRRVTLRFSGVTRTLTVR